MSVWVLNFVLAVNIPLLAMERHIKPRAVNLSKKTRNKVMPYYDLESDLPRENEAENGKVETTTFYYFCIDGKVCKYIP
jgi:hypothetical protein